MSKLTAEILKQLSAACARVDIGNNQGSGYLIHERYVVTCRHVVENIEERVKLYFPNLLSNGKKERLANIIDHDEINDCALLELIEPLSARDAIPLRFSTELPEPDSECWVYGYPSFINQQEATGIPAKGEIRAPSCQDDNSKPAFSLYSAEGKGTELAGFSGSPVVSPSGIVLGHLKRILGSGTRAELGQIYASRGSNVLKFLQKNEVPPSIEDRINNQLRTLKKNLQYNVDFFLEKRVGYNSNEFVREIFSWDKEQRFIVFSGLSGQGKTWNLCALLKQCIENNLLCVVLVASDSAEKDLNKTSNILWQDGLEKDEEIKPRKLLKFLNENKISINVFVDGVQDFKWIKDFYDECRDFIEKDIFKICLTTEERHGKYLNKIDSKIKNHEIGDFKDEELHKYLKIKQCIIDDISWDVKIILRRPIFASIFCKLKENFWHPKNEYELLEEYWNKLISDNEQPDNLFDVTNLKSLADNVFDNEILYPWEFDYIQKHNIDNNCFKRLEKIGWIRKVGQEKSEISHDRLLNWLIAEFLVSELNKKHINIEKLNDFINSKQNKKYGDRKLSYLFMDVLWLLSSTENNDHNICNIIEKASLQWNSDSLYENLLPTLGSCIIKHIWSFVKSKKENSYIPYDNIAKGFVLAAKDNKIEIYNLIKESLGGTSVITQRLALHCLKYFPNKIFLDPTWKIHTLNYNNKDNNKSQNYYLLDISYNAMKSCLELWPEWILEIENIETNIKPLASLFCNIKNSNADQFWPYLKQKLLINLQENSSEFIRCVNRFQDKNHINDIVNFIHSGNNFISHTAFSTLTTLDKNLAIQQLEKISPNNISYTRHNWLPSLLINYEVETKNRILALIDKKIDEDWSACFWYQGNEQEIDKNTTIVLLRLLEDYLDAIKNKNDNNIKEPLFWLMNLLIKSNSLDSSIEIHKLANQKLDQKLSQYIISLIEDHRYDSAEFDSGRNLLRKISGCGITNLSNSLLSHKFEEKYITRTALIDSLINPDKKSFDLICELAKNKASSDTDQIWEQQDAAEALALLERTDELLEILLQWGIDILSTELWLICTNINEIDTPEISKILQLLNSTDENNISNAIITLGICKKTEFIPEIMEKLKNSSFNSRIAISSVLALCMLSYKEIEYIDLIKLKISKANNSFTTSLLSTNHDNALDILEDSFSISPENGINSGWINLMNKIFYKRKEQKKKLKTCQILSDVVKYHPTFMRFDSFFLASLEIKEEKILNILNDALYYPDKHSFEISFAAIKYKFQVDPITALEACRVLLKKKLSTADAEDLWGYIFDQDPNISLQLAINYFSSKETLTSIRWEICRILRNFENKNLLNSCIENMLQSNLIHEKLNALELIGWQKDNLFSDKLIENFNLENSYQIKMESYSALKRQKSFQEAIKIKNHFNSASKTHKFSLILSYVRLADPHLSVLKLDDLNIITMLNAMTSAMQDLFWKERKSILDKLKNIAEDLDKKRDEI
jgi:hypothetical protein